MRILFTATPGWGHIHPMVPLSRALRDRGDDVLWVTGADACERLEREGFSAAPAGLGEREGMAELYKRFPEIHSMPPNERPDYMFPRLFGQVRAAAMLRDLGPVAEKWSPDLFVCDASEFAGHLQARVLDIPSVTHSFGALLPEHRVARAAAELAPLCAERGLEPRPYGGTYDHLYIDIYPRSLQPADRRHVPATQLLGPSAYAIAGDDALPEWVTSVSEPLVYVTFGTVFRNDTALLAILDAVRALPVRVVVTVGPHGDPASLGTQPENVHVARYIPQERLLGRCAVVVSHGGSGTFLASLAAKVPQLCIPQAADQFFNAAACERSGAGLALQPGAVSVGSVRAAVERLLAEEAFRAAAARVSAEIAAMPTPREVADRLHSDFG